LTPSKIDTNSLYLTDQLNGLGIEVRQKGIVGDDPALLTAAIQDALRHVDVLVLTGGLGPTEDDITRDAVAAALGRQLEFHQDICDAIEERFRSRGRKMADINKRQAFVIAGAEVLANPTGTAPGLWIETGGKLVMLLPGPPSEMKSVFGNECLPRLERRVPGVVIRSRFYRVTGMTESDLDTLIAPVYRKYSNPATTVLASAGDIQVHLRARCASAAEAESLLAEVGDPVAALLGDRLYSRNGDSLEAVIGTLLQARGATLAIAESLTGGALGERITTVAGSSAYFLGGVLAYSDRMKEQLLGVVPQLIQQHTSVSEEVAQAMAAGVRTRTGADFAIATTGEAGPASNSGAAPGTVWIGWASAKGTGACRFVMPGDRARVRGFTTNAALDLLRRRLLAPEAN
jgi:nicotinamide-nucleotide amidase